MRLMLWMCVLAVGLVGCGGSSTPGGGGEPVVVVTIQPIASLVGQIVPEQVTVRCLVPAGATPHGFEPTGRDAEAMHGCAALVAVGMHFDDWAADALKRFGGGDSKLYRLSTLAGISDGEHAHHDHGHDHEHDHAGPNPHIWLDPVLMRQAVAALGDKLAADLPAHADAIERNTRQLLTELTALDAAFTEQLKPFAGRKIVTYHNAFDRLAERYDLTVAATLTPIDAPGSMTPARLEQAIEAINAHKLHVLFTEPQFPADAAAMIRNETDIAVLTLDPIGDPNDPQRDTYQKLMRYNVDTLVQGLSRE